jgi:hypothetical protein
LTGHILAHTPLFNANPDEHIRQAEDVQDTQLLEQAAQAPEFT